jgi:short-subunit dehydrogenase
MGKKNNVAIITGASSGMGREFALQIARRYSGIQEFWLIARRTERLQEVERKLSGKTVKLLSLDLGQQEDIEQFEQVLLEEKPQVKMLINAAGYGIIGHTDKMEYRDCTGMIDVNCRALTAITHITLPYLSRGSRIIQMASSAAFLPQPGFAVYAASKSYVLSFSKALGRELREREISVTAVCPGPVKTEFFEIAERYESVKLYKKMTMVSAGKVVHQALTDAAHGRSVSVYGGFIKVFRVLAQILPADFLMMFVR